MCCIFIIFCQSCSCFAVVFWWAQGTFTHLVDELLCRVRHEDTVAPGGTAGVHVLSGFSVLLTVGVAERKARMSDTLPGFVVHCRDSDIIYCPTWAEILCPLPEQHHQRRRLLYHISKAVKWKKQYWFRCTWPGGNKHRTHGAGPKQYPLLDPPEGISQKRWRLQGECHSLLCRCPPWTAPDAGRQTASPRCGAAPAGEAKRGPMTQSGTRRESAGVLATAAPLTWWSLSFSSQMILSTWSLLLFFTVCACADVDKCCRRQVISGGRGLQIREPNTETLGNSHTWTRFCVSRRKLKSPNRKKGSEGGVQWPSDILQWKHAVHDTLIMTLQTIQNNWGMIIQDWL